MVCALTPTVPRLRQSNQTARESACHGAKSLKKAKIATRMVGRCTVVCPVIGGSPEEEKPQGPGRAEANTKKKYGAASNEQNQPGNSTKPSNSRAFDQACLFPKPTASQQCRATGPSNTPRPKNIAKQRKLSRFGSHLKTKSEAASEAVIQSVKTHVAHRHPREG